MRKSKERAFDSGIYARLREMQMSEIDRRNAIAALRQADEIVNAILWVRERLADFGHIFLKPSLKH